MVKIITDGGMITFQDTVTGVTKTIGQNLLWVSFKSDTVNFLQVTIPTDGMDGTPFFSARASNLEINGETYTIEELKNGEGLSDLFNTMGWGYEIVEELPDSGETGVIYLVYDDETGTYTEYLWLSQEQVWEELGSVGDIDLGNYYNKTQIDTMMAGKASVSDLATVATSGSYNDLSDKPVIPEIPTNVSAFTNDAGYLTEHQSLANYYNKSQTDNLLNGKVNIGSLATVATSGSYNDLTNKPDLSTKQDVLVSGVNIKTINSQSILGEGNINIEGGGGGTQVQSNWAETDTTSMAFIQNKPTNVSAFTNDAGYLTSHQSLADVFADVAYDSATKRINFYGKGDTQHTTALAYVDASDFVVDGMVEDVRIENGNLVIDFNTDSGITDISIPLTDIFDPSNYYTKSEVDTALAGKANSSSLATVATTGAYSDLTGTPTIPAAQVNSDWNASSGVAQILNKPDLTQYASTSDVENAIENVMGGGWSHTYEYSESDLGQTVYESYPGTYYDSYSEKYLYFIPTAMTVSQNDDMAVSGDAVYNALQGKQDTLTAGTNITIATDQQTGNLVISASGGGSGTVTGVKMNNGSPISPDANGVVDLGTVITAHQTVDTVLSSSSNNPIANSTVYAVVGQIEQALAILNGTAS